MGQLSRKYAKVYIMRDRVGVWATIVDVHFYFLHTYHHNKNSGTCRQEEEYEEITPETVSPNESMHVGELLHLVVCACVRLSLRARHHVCS